MADGGLRRSEAAALAWGDVEFWLDGTARLTVQKGTSRSNIPRRPVPASVRRGLPAGEWDRWRRIDRLGPNADR